MSDFYGLLNLISGNLGISFTDLTIIILLVFLVIFYAIDLRLGILLTFVASSGLFIVFYELGMNYNHILLFMLLSFGLLVLSLYITANKTGGFIQ